jgi:hypothetical protein
MVEWLKLVALGLLYSTLVTAVTFGLVLFVVWQTGYLSSEPAAHFIAHSSEVAR